MATSRTTQALLLFNRPHGPAPIGCDFAFVSDVLASCVRRIEVNLRTQASDHRPVPISLDRQ